jgi:hypothetical protein
VRAPIFQLDAFTTRRFAGNPAAVIVMEAFPGGEIVCRLAGDRVELEGACVFYLEGEVEL